MSGKSVIPGKVNSRFFKKKECKKPRQKKDCPVGFHLFKFFNLDDNIILSRFVKVILIIEEITFFNKT